MTDPLLSYLSPASSYWLVISLERIKRMVKLQLVKLQLVKLQLFNCPTMSPILLFTPYSPYSPYGPYSPYRPYTSIRGSREDLLEDQEILQQVRATDHGFTLQGPAQDVLLRRWCVYAQKHSRWRKVTPGALVASILGVGGHLDFFPGSAACIEAYLPIEHEYLRHGVEHHHGKIVEQVQREGREFDLIFPTPERLICRFAMPKPKAQGTNTEPWRS